MSFNDNIALEMPAVLHRCPASLALPTADPNALAVECLLRFVGAQYTKKDSALPVTIEVPPSAGKAGKEQQYSGFPTCMQFIEANALLDAEVLPRDQQPLALCVQVLAEKSIFPAFLYVIHKDDALFRGAIKRSILPKVATFWQRIRGSYRNDVLLHSGLCGNYNSVDGALAELERSLKALEALHVAHATATGTFFLGTERPCSADALAYAAVSSFFHADFVGHKASPLVINTQCRLKEECPVLVKYIEKLRMIYFEDYNGVYTLRATTSDSKFTEGAQTPMDDSFRRGRIATLMCTFGFAAVYFILVNADVILELLSEEDDEQNDDLREDEETVHSG